MQGRPVVRRAWVGACRGDGLGSTASLRPVLPDLALDVTRPAFGLHEHTECTIPELHQPRRRCSRRRGVDGSDRIATNVDILASLHRVAAVGWRTPRIALPSGQILLCCNISDGNGEALRQR